MHPIRLERVLRFTPVVCTVLLAACNAVPQRTTDLAPPLEQSALEAMEFNGGFDEPMAAMPTPASDPSIDPFIRLFQQWRGTRHRDGGMSRDGIDCSAFVHIGYRDIYGVRLPRTTRDQAKAGIDVPRKQLRAGDLVFFKTGRQRRHVGIFLGKSRFLHVSSKVGVTISSMRNRYWSRRYWKAVRIDPVPETADATRRTGLVGRDLG